MNNNGLYMLMCVYIIARYSVIPFKLFIRSRSLVFSLLDSYHIDCNIIEVSFTNTQYWQIAA